MRMTSSVSAFPSSAISQHAPLSWFTLMKSASDSRESALSAFVIHSRLYHL